MNADKKIINLLLLPVIPFSKESDTVRKSRRNKENIRVHLRLSAVKKIFTNHYTCGYRFETSHILR